MFKIILYINIFAILVSFYSCQKRVDARITNVVEEWTHKEIKFDKGYIFTRFGKDSVYNSIPTSQYKVLVYTDSIGCVGCNLKLSQWMEWMKQIDSISANKVSFLFFIHPKDVTDLLVLLRRQNFNVPVCIDRNNSLNKLNHFPSHPMLQTFLLDRHNKVLAIGNPMLNPKIKDLYFNIISGKNYEEGSRIPMTKIAISDLMVNMGSFLWTEDKEKRVILRNVGPYPLVINEILTSCGCIVVEYDKKPILPTDSAYVTIKYKADHPEHFNKTVTLYCNTDDSPLQLKVSGNAQ